MLIFPPSTRVALAWVWTIEENRRLKTRENKADLIVYRNLSTLTLSVEMLENSSWGQDMIESPPSPV
jgi:hypothetical protein